MFDVKYKNTNTVQKIFSNYMSFLVSQWRYVCRMYVWQMKTWFIDALAILSSHLLTMQVRIVKFSDTLLTSS